MNTHDTNWLDGLSLDSLGEAEPLPTLPGAPFLHAGMSATISGPTGTGRSELIGVVLFDAARFGLRCVYLGGEVTLTEFTARSEVIGETRGVDATDLDVRYLDLAATIERAWAQPEAWVEGIGERYEVCSIDPLSDVADMLDLDFESGRDYVRWHNRLVRPLAAVGVTVLIADNEGHTARGRGAGTAAKGWKTDLNFSSTLRPEGLRVTCTKVRSVQAAFQKGDSWTFLRDSRLIVPHGSTRANTETQPDPAIVQKVCEAVSVRPGITTTALKKSVSGRNERILVALRSLVSEGHIETVQNGQTVRHYASRNGHITEPSLVGSAPR